MNAEGWQLLVMQAVEHYMAGDTHRLQLLARHLEMCDQTKQVLRDLRYGWTGVDILETVRLVPAAARASTGTEEA